MPYWKRERTGLEQLSEEGSVLMTNLRIGHGYDVHRLGEGRDLILGGIPIPFGKGLVGHSDADVLLHAIMDAMLGAAAKGDIGKLFPDSSDDYKDISSMVLLRRVKLFLSGEGYRVVNLDATILAEAPKLSPYTHRMCVAVADTLGIPSDCVSIKATTEEGLGFTGKGLGIAAHAVVLMEKII